jgi:hypothetical protein
MSRNFVISVIGAFALYGLLALFALVYSVLGTGGMIIVSSPVLFWCARALYLDLFVDEDDE